MNENIKKLQIRAAEKINESIVCETWEYAEYEWHELFTEEFAKAIVYECFRIMHDCDLHKEDEILAHFGIVDKSRW